MSQDHEYMDTGALTEDAVPEPVPAPDAQPPVEAPGSPAGKADEQLDAPDAQQAAEDGNSLPPGAYAS